MQREKVIIGRNHAGQYLLAQPVESVAESGFALQQGERLLIGIDGGTAGIEHQMMACVQRRKRDYLVVVVGPGLGEPLVRPVPLDQLGPLSIGQSTFAHLGIPGLTIKVDTRPTPFSPKENDRGILDAATSLLVVPSDSARPTGLAQTLETPAAASPLWQDFLRHVQDVGVFRSAIANLNQEPEQVAVSSPGGGPLSFAQRYTTPGQRIGFRELVHPWKPESNKAALIRTTDNIFFCRLSTYLLDGSRSAREGNAESPEQDEDFFYTLRMHRSPSIGEPMHVSGYDGDSVTAPVVEIVVIPKRTPFGVQLDTLPNSSIFEEFSALSKPLPTWRCVNPWVLEAAADKAAAEAVLPQTLSRESDNGSDLTLW